MIEKILTYFAAWAFLLFAFLVYSYVLATFIGVVWRLFNDL